MPNISGSFSGTVNSQTVVFLKDAPDHQLSLAEIAGVQQSPDPQWEAAKLTYWGANDLLSGQGTQRGYYVNVHADGDRDWGTFEGKLTVAGSEVTLQGVFAFSGGSGALSGITGGGTYVGRMASPVDVEMAWEGTYQLGEAKAQTA
jgi:hypothetical protein